MAKYWQESPPILQEFLNYHASILSHSAKTVDEYFLDLRSFFRYLKVRRNPALSQTPFSEISITISDSYTGEDKDCLVHRGLSSHKP